MTKHELSPRIIETLKKKTKESMTEPSIRVELSRIRKDSPFLTLNAAAEIFARKRSFSVGRYLTDKDRESLKALRVEKIKVPAVGPRQKRKIIEIAKYETDDKLLRSHIEEINKAYTFGCYTATFVLSRKVTENLVIHHILMRKYPENTLEHRSKYFDFNRRRFLDFDKLLNNLRDSSADFAPQNKLVERIADKASQFKETANEMTHSLYHIAKRKEIDDMDFQSLLDLIHELEKMHFPASS